MNININGSKTREIAPGNLLFGKSYIKMNNLVYIQIGMILNKGVTTVETLFLHIEIAEARSLQIKTQTTNDCTGSKWGKWGQCSESCGKGFRERVLTKADGTPCEKSYTGPRKEKEICEIRSINCEAISGTQSNLQKISFNIV